MLWLIKLLGIIMVAVGAIYFIKPTIMKKAMRFWTHGKRLILGGFLSLLIGLILLFSASNCSLPWYVVIMGIISVLKGIFSFIAGRKRIESIVNNWTHSPVSTLRILAVIIVLLGALLIYAV